MASVSVAFSAIRPSQMNTLFIALNIGFLSLDQASAGKRSSLCDLNAGLCHGLPLRISASFAFVAADPGAVNISLIAALPASTNLQSICNEPSHQDYAHE